MNGSIAGAVLTSQAAPLERINSLVLDGLTSLESKRAFRIAIDVPIGEPALTVGLQAPSRFGGSFPGHAANLAKGRSAFRCQFAFKGTRTLFETSAPCFT